MFELGHEVSLDSYFLIYETIIEPDLPFIS